MIAYVEFAALCAAVAAFTWLLWLSTEKHARLVEQRDRQLALAVEYVMCAAGDGWNETLHDIHELPEVPA